MVVAAEEVDIPESWSGVVHDAPFVRHAKPRSWLEWAQLLYSERHLHPRGDGRVAPATTLAAFTLCDVAVSRAYTLEMTATAGGEKRVTRGRFAEKTIAERWPRGGFVRGVVEAAEDPQGEAYTVAYSDGPYRTDDASAPPPGYARGATTASKDGVRVAAALWWRRYGKVGLVFARTRRSGDAPGPRFLFYRLVGAWPRCGDLRGEVWRLWTYQFVHTSWLHLAANCCVQLLFGVPMEAVHGWRLVLLIYSAGVVAGPLVCAVCDAYAVVVGASGGAYALLGAHVGAIWKDWDRLATGTHIPRGARLALFSSILLADVSQWYLTRQDDVSYSAHLGGGGTGLLLGVLVLRRRPTRRHCFRRLRRPAFLCALIFYVFFLVFGISWSSSAARTPRTLRI
ncbi:serine-type endopeptidase [Aureococcus anophagefferens]|nr:serine-type endopeptidase [Aureococcus anophagefferens]